MQARKIAFVLPVLLLVVLASGCVEFFAPREINNDTPGGDQNQNQVSEQKLYEIVMITDSGFDPPEVTIRKDGTVTWINDDTTAHVIYSDTFPLEGNLPGLSSRTLSTGEGYSYTFNRTGTFGYHCRIHPSMKGSVTVVE